MLNAVGSLLVPSSPAPTRLAFDTNIQKVVPSSICFVIENGVKGDWQPLALDWLKKKCATDEKPTAELVYSNNLLKIYSYTHQSTWPKDSFARDFDGQLNLVLLSSNNNNNSR